MICKLKASDIHGINFNECNPKRITKTSRKERLQGLSFFFPLDAGYGIYVSIYCGLQPFALLREIRNGSGGGGEGSASENEKRSLHGLNGL